MTRQFKLLGNLHIEEDGRSSPLLNSSKGAALLAYLIALALAGALSRVHRK